jgi:membrane-bound ClpP family serine protease
MNASNVRLWLDPVLAVLFLMLGTTGLLMLLHVRKEWVEELHEATGVLFLLAGVTHLILNWKTLARYFKLTS